MTDLIATYNARKEVLTRAWNNLPLELQTDNQVVGQHWAHCGYTMGPAYCSFGCSHCYLPKAANKQPLVELNEMKRMIDANRELLGPGGALQITGGDVVDAYWRAGRSQQLIEVVRYCLDAGLVPMLMTHGHKLLQNPGYFEQLVVEGGLRKLSIHIDITMSGKDGYRHKCLHNETELHPLRDRFVKLVIGLRKKTGIKVHAAQTITVTEKNIESIGEIINWLVGDKDNMKVCRTLSFQTESAVGRTRIGAHPVTPSEVWTKICEAVNADLPRDHLLFGHPECSSTATCIVSSNNRKILALSGNNAHYRRFWSSVLKTFSGVAASGRTGHTDLILKVVSVLRRPRIVIDLVRFVTMLLKQQTGSAKTLLAFLCGRAQGFNLVMHNFIHESQINGVRSAQTQARLQACSFKGAVEIDGHWQAVSMCEMNAGMREQIYHRRRRQSK